MIEAFEADVFDQYEKAATSRCLTARIEGNHNNRISSFVAKLLSSILVNFDLSTLIELRSISRENSVEERTSQ